MTSADLWATVGTILGTILFVIVPGIAYAYYVLEDWIGDTDMYPEM